MSVIVVFDEEYPSKKCSVKITPSMSVQSISHQACQAMQLSPPEAYVLCLKKQVLQTSLSVRLAGLSNGSKLNMIYRGITNVQEKVTIALQTEEAGRLIDKFDPSITLWEVLLHFESKASLNLVRKTQISVPKTMNLFQSSNSTALYVMPVCVFMNKEYSTISLLRSTSIRDLGLESGSAAIRLLGQIKENPLSSYLEEIERPIIRKEISSTARDDVQQQQRLQSVEVDPATKLTPPLTSAAIPASSEIFSHTRKASESDTSQANLAEDEIPSGLDKDLKIYKPVQEGAGTASMELPPSFFTLSAAELKIMIDSQKSKLNSLENRPLMTQAMREREQKLKEHKHPKCRIRVRFADRFTLEATFYSGSFVGELYQVVSESLDGSQSSLPFILYMSPPVTDLDPKKNFWAQKLAPASLVYIRFTHDHDKKPMLKMALLDAAIDHPVSESSKSDSNTIASSAADADVSTTGDIVPGSRLVNVANPGEPITFSTNNQLKNDKPKWFRSGASNKDALGLSILATAVTTPISEEVNVRVVTLGLDKEGFPFELFSFPSGHFYSLDRISRLLFDDSGSKILSYLTAEELGTALMQDISLKVVYISCSALKSIGIANEISNLVCLADYTVSALLHGDQKVAEMPGYLQQTDNSLVESFMKTVICPYRLERRYSRPQLKRPAPSSVEAIKGKERNKRLSIETKFSEKLESNSNVVEQMKSSYMTVKQQQQAIIDSRTRSAHPDNPPSGFPRIRKRLGSIDQLVSPINTSHVPKDFSKMPAEPLSACPSNHNSQHLHSNSSSVNPQQRGYSPLGNQSKDQFMATCEMLFDNHENTTKLQIMLKEQIRKSATLLYTLSSSAQMIESLVKTHFKENQRYYNDKFGMALGDLNRRLGKLETDVFGIQEANSFIPSAVPKDNDEGTLTAALDTIKEK